MTLRYSFSLAWAYFMAISTAVLAQSPKVITHYGEIEGRFNTDKTICIYQGIPFAAPPIGELRWKAPQDPEPWTGVLSCKAFKASPIQNKPQPFYCWSEEFIAKPEPLSEDCLYLNIWAPAKKESEKLPVFVWIYGGGLSSGSANCDIYDGEEMAKQGIVFVSINYRVGVLGFMAHPELSAESGHNASGNYGFMDQLQALRWIRGNIEAFGGDPDNVTIAGQSAGSFSVNAQIASPLAEGFFHKAIAQSGGLFSGRLIKTLSEAEKQGLEFMKLANASDLEGLRSLPADKLQELSNQPGAGRFGVVTDGYFLPTDIKAHFEQGKHNQVPLIAGWVSGDGALGGTSEVTAESFQKMAHEQYGDRAEEFLKIFPASSQEEALASAAKLGLLGFGAVPAHRLANYSSKNTWLYEFTHVPTDKPDFPNYGAFHTSEVPFALHTLHLWERPWKSEERLLEQKMSSYWVNFAKTGNPNGKGLTKWNPYNSPKNEILSLDIKIEGIQNKYKKAFDFLTE